MQHNFTRQRTATEDSANGVHKVTVRAWRGIQRTEIMLRHPASQHWCGAGGVWLEGRAQAVRFITNLDALVYCEALGVRGVVVAFDECGGMLYELNVELILDAISSDPRIRFMAARANDAQGNVADGMGLPPTTGDARS